MNPIFTPSPRLFQLTAIILFALALLIVANRGHGQANRNQSPASLTTPISIAANSVPNDERAVDIYPAVAYDASSQRFLVVWLTLRNATSASAGFDLYGLFLDANGQASGNQFRISDSNNVARSALPSVVALDGSFVVAWTQRGSTCRLALQGVTDSSNATDSLLDLGLNVHQHSPQMVYNAPKQRLVVAFAAGDDYLPPVFSGASVDSVADCGNNTSSTSEVKASEFHFDGNNVVIDSTTTLSENAGGAFRPALALNSTFSSTFSSTLGQYLVAWEDRRNAAGAAYRFDVYAQRLNADLGKTGTNESLSSGGSYETGDNSATWTPRPALSANNSTFLTSWFERSSSNSSETRTVQTQFFEASTSQPKFAAMRMTFAQSHPGDAPSGFLAATFHAASSEFLLGVTSHLESLNIYAPSLRLQRLNSSGQLLRLDGTIRPSAGVGDKLDMSLTLQLSLGLAAFVDGVQTVYGKHPSDGQEQNIDIWGNRILFGAAGTGTPTVTLTVTLTVTPSATATGAPSGSTETPTPTATATPASSATPSSQYLPLVTK